MSLTTTQMLFKQINIYTDSHHRSHKHDFWVLQSIWVSGINTQTTQIRFKHLELLFDYCNRIWVVLDFWSRDGSSVRVSSFVPTPNVIARYLQYRQRKWACILCTQFLREVDVIMSHPNLRINLSTIISCAPQEQSRTQVDKLQMYHHKCLT